MGNQRILISALHGWHVDVFDNLFIFIFRLKLGANMRGKVYLKSFQIQSLLFGAAHLSLYRLDIR